MARIKKYAENINPHLTDYQVFVNDNNPNSDYFRITEFKDTFTGGKNGFLIEGSQHLLESIEIKLEILDVNGDPIYYEPGDGVPEYYEGISKLVSVHIYEDTPIGLAKITVLGELKTYIDSAGATQPIPDEWKGVYNVKWEKEFKVNRLIPNEDRVRFYKRPKVSIEEIVKPLYSNIVASKTNTGNVSGIPLAPLEGQSLSEYSLPTSYLLTITDTGPYAAWTSSIIDNTISVPSLGYTSTAQEIINKTQLVVTNPYTDSSGLVQSFTNQPYTTTFEYVEGVDNIATALTGSFAKITLTDLTSFVGDVARVKVFRKSQSDLSDFQFVQEIALEANELLIDYDTTTKNQENYGLFTTDIIKEYWVTSSNSLTATYNQSFLYDSVKLDSNSGVQKFHTSNSINITNGAEYTLDFKIRAEENVGSGYIRAYLSGSKLNTSNTGYIQVEQDIIKVPIQNAVLQKTSVTQNIIAEEMQTASLYFDVSGTKWYVSDVSLKASQESSFSPDEITFIQPVPRQLANETFIYRFEFYDINNNYIPILVEKTKTFTGGNLQTIQKNLQLVPSSLYFQFDSGSRPVPPTVINIDVIKTLLTGSVTFTSKSYDFDGNELTSLQYASGQYPGLLNNITTDSPELTVSNFTGSRTDKNVQYVEITGEVEGYTDTIVITKVLDGFGGVNHIIRPYRGTTIRNSSTQSLEIQAVRIDGINDIEISSTTETTKGWNRYQLHVLSQSADLEYFINLQKAVDQNFVKGLSVGELGSKELNYNAIFNRDSINNTRTVYLIQSSSAITGQPAYIASASVLASITLEDLQDGLDSGFFAYNTETFTIDPRNQITFTPVSASVTGSFYKRGTNVEAFTASFEVFPSMSLNTDFEPQYWMYYVTGPFHPNISVVATDANKNVIPSRAISSYTGLTNQQSKTLNVKLTYTEDYSSASISIDKTFTIVPQGKPGDETIIFETVPSSVTLNSNSEGIVLDYKPSITDIKLKQGSRYLIFTASRAAGTFHIATSSISSQNITPGNVHFTSSFGTPYTASLIVSQSSNFTQLSGSITFPLIIHPYYTSSIYTQSIVQNFTKAVDGPPPIDVIITPSNVILNANEVGYISNYSTSDTIIQLREGSKYLVFNSGSTSPGTFRFDSTPTSNITIGTIQGNSTTAATSSFSLFNYPHTTASVTYNIVAHPYSLGPGHAFTSSVINRTQQFTKNVAPAGARTVKLSTTSNVINFDGDGVILSPTDPVILTATATGLTGSGFYQFFKGEDALGSISTTNTYTIGGGNEVAPGETAAFTVTLRDGSSSTSAPIRAQDSITIAGVQAGGSPYNVYLTREVASVVYKVSGEITLTNTNTNIVATKGGTALTHVTTFSPQTQDQFGNDIGSLGEYSASIFSKSNHLTLLSNTLSGDPAQFGGISSWSSPETNTTAQIVYKIDLENGKEILYKTQSFSVQFEGATGPGVIMRGLWNEVTDYIGSVETTNQRRDAVIFPDPSGSAGVTHYWAAISGSGPSSVGPQIPTSPTLPVYTDTSYWQYLGQEDFFVAAKIAIFEESFVKNTINVGNNPGSSFANIVLAGGRTDPYIAVGQSGTVGTAGTSGTSLNPGGAVIGYERPGIFMGIYEQGTAGTSGRFSVVNSGGSKYLKWTGSDLVIKGDITADNGTFNGVINASGGTFTGYVNAGGVKLGVDVNGSNDGIYIDGNNYWYSTGDFKVGDGTSYVSYSGGTMAVKGSITVTGGDAATQTYANTAASSSASTALTSANSYTLAVDNKVFTDSSGKLVKTPSNTGSGLYIGDTYLGYFNGSEWKTYMASNGNFYLSGGTSNNGLFWNGEVLNVLGTITSTDGKIGGWNITPTSLYSSNAAIYLDAGGRKIIVNDTSGIPRISINQSDTFSNFTVGSPTSGTQNKVLFNSSPPYSGTQTGIVTVSGTSFTATSGTTWRIGATEDSSPGSQAAYWYSAFDSAIYQYRVYAKKTTSPFTEYNIFGSSATNYDGGNEVLFGTNASGVATIIGDGGTYEIKIDAILNAYGGTTSGAEYFYTPKFAWSIEPVSAFTEIIAGGIQSGNSAYNYVKIYRDGQPGATSIMLSVGGEITATGNITAFYTSDIRLKKNIKPILNAIEKIDKMNGVEFDWKDGFDTIHSAKGHDIGLIAQDVESVLPEIVNTRENGYKAIRYEKIVAVLIEAIKELKQQVDELKKNK